MHQKKSPLPPPPPPAQGLDPLLFSTDILSWRKKKWDQEWTKTTQGVDQLTFEREMDDCGKYPAGILIPKKILARDFHCRQATTGKC